MKSYRIVDTMAKEAAKTQPCVVCARFEADPHHLISRGAGGHDLEWNLMPLSRDCHTMVHKIGLTKMSEKYPQVKQWLLKHDWEFDSHAKKWRHF
jgi:5-methylcytosine-specific restriction endonuclease McrA